MRGSSTCQKGYKIRKLWVLGSQKYENKNLKFLVIAKSKLKGHRKGGSPFDLVL